jgi:hypothetical protein
MTRQANTYWLRFPTASTWRRWETDADNPYSVAVEAATELRCRLPIDIEVRGDNTDGAWRVSVVALGTFGDNGTIEEIRA